jgi:hypothetical protein
MSAPTKNQRPVLDSLKENRKMPKRRVSLIVTVAVLALLAVLPIASASAAEPWWQILTGSRPSNLWEAAPKEIQEVRTEADDFGNLVALVKAGGETVGCLGAGFGSVACGFVAPGVPVVETAEQLEAALEPVYSSGDVTVSGGPAGSAAFTVTTDWGPPLLEVSALGFGSASSEVVSKDSGRLVITLTNLSGETVDGSSNPVTIVDKLPQGVVAYGVEAAAPRWGKQKDGTTVNVACAVKAADEVVCTYGGAVTPFEAIEIEIMTALTGSPPSAGAPGEVTVVGGNAASARALQDINVNAKPVEFGVEHFTAIAEEEGGQSVIPGLGGAPVAQAGSHPFQFTTTLQLNAGRIQPIPDYLQGPQVRRVAPVQPAMPRNLTFSLPVGLVGNASSQPQCDTATFLRAATGINDCPDASVVGVSSVTFVEELAFGLFRMAVPLFNLEPGQGNPARFGFMVAGDPVIIDFSVDPENSYKLKANVRNVPQTVQLLSATTTVWGVPGDPRHDKARGWNCVFRVSFGDCKRPPNLSEAAFLRMPVQCASPLDFGLELEPWNVPIGTQVAGAAFTDAPLTGCNRVPFDPSIQSSPTSKLAENPSGLDFRLKMPNFGLLNKDGIAEGQAKKVEVDLPKGMTINPSQGEGLVGCSPADLARESFALRPGEGCPEASKVGTVQIATPLLEEEARGNLYVASPHDNPFDSLLALYMVAKIPERGILIKQAGVVDPDPGTGQLTTTFDDLPQLPFSSFSLQFRPGARAPLVTPPACGTYDVVARFTPWSAADPNNPTPEEIVTRTSSFEVERGVDGGACPSGGVPPFRPGLIAGTINNAAGKYSPFNLRLTRNDGEQEFTNFSIKLPPGVVGKLAGIPFCSDAAIAAAKARTGSNGGQEELDNPSCSAASQVGRTLVGAGVGTSLTYVPGKVYLAGPYNAAPLSVVAITAAKVGPFDLGTVVVRQALKINPETAEVFVDATGSDPIPHIIQGIPVHARDIRVYVDRPEFVLNPTSCERTSTASTVVGSGRDFGSDADNVPVTVTSPFQAADCASLGFKPRLKLTLKGKTTRGGNPALRAVFRPRKGDANAARISVALPHSEFLDQSHIRTVCTRVQFKAGSGNGTQCPKGSIYGHARAWTPLFDQPLEGPVFLRSSENPLPDMVLALRGLVDIHGVGRIDSVKGGIRNTFDFVPDAPITKVVLDLQGGKKGLLENSTNICRGKHKATVKMKGHNGKLRNFAVPLKPKCPKKHAKRRR